MSKQTNKYYVPIELTREQPYSWLPIHTYQYKLYADAEETKFTHIKFIQINNLIIGEHMPTKLQTSFNKTALQVKNSTVKVVSEIRNVVDGVADLAVAAGSEMKDDAVKTAGIAIGLFSKVKNFAKEKLKREEAAPKTVEEQMDQDTDLN